MITKIIVIVGVSVGSVLALFLMGYFLDKKQRKNEQDMANSDRKAQPGEK